MTGVRQDAYAKANPLVVEREKPAAEKGSFLHPEVHGQTDVGSKARGTSRVSAARSRVLA